MRPVVVRSDFGLDSDSDFTGVEWQPDLGLATTARQRDWAHPPSEVTMFASMLQFGLNQISGCEFEICVGKWQPKVKGQLDFGLSRRNRF